MAPTNTIVAIRARRSEVNGCFLPEGPTTQAFKDIRMQRLHDQCCRNAPANSHMAGQQRPVTHSCGRLRPSTPSVSRHPPAQGLVAAPSGLPGKGSDDPLDADVVALGAQGDGHWLASAITPEPTVLAIECGLQYT